ncbi:phage head closure protein [Psychrobacter arenosus]|uniref:phage head closure protein n=1 Tax=Psychrobacter arenosus TaxID=256326 RepID=UPI0019182E19|nr:phage head closure protein [Psychrobacter arenosus]
MALRAGELRHRVTIEVYTSGGRDEDGFEIEPQWTEYRKVWAKITPLSSRDVITAQAAQSEVVARMKLRYKSALGIDTTMRVIWKGRVYAIDSMGLDDSDNGMTYTTFNLSSGIEHFRD